MKFKDFFFHFFFVYPLFTDDKKRSKCFGVKREARNFGHVMMQFYDCEVIYEMFHILNCGF